MEMKSVPVNENTMIVIRTSADLFLSGDEAMEVRFFGSEDRMQVRKDHEPSENLRADFVRAIFQIRFFLEH